MSSKETNRSKIPADAHRQAESLARALLRPINRPSASQAQADGDDEVVFMRKPPKPEKKGKGDSE